MVIVLWCVMPERSCWAIWLAIVGVDVDAPALAIPSTLAARPSAAAAASNLVRFMVDGTLLRLLRVVYSLWLAEIYDVLKPEPVAATTPLR
jgi:hypothetical protein